MKKFTLYFVILLFAAFTFQSCGSTQTAFEKQRQASEIESAVLNSDFTFKAKFAYPTGYKSTYLAPAYDVIVCADTIKAYLPYFGRAYKAPVDPREGGYRFSSTDFEYQVSPGKNETNWIVRIDINDLDRPVTFQFDIWAGGSGHLSVNDVNRQSISYQGEIITKSLDEINQ